MINLNYVCKFILIIVYCYVIYYTVVSFILRLFYNCKTASCCVYDHTSLDNKYYLVLILIYMSILYFLYVLAYVCIVLQLLFVCTIIIITTTTCKWLLLYVE